MMKSQTENQGYNIGFEPIYQIGLGLPIRNTVTENVKQLQEAIGVQQEKTERLLKENNTCLSSRQVD